MLCSVALGVILSGGSVIDLDATLFVQLAIFFATFLVLKSLVFKPVLQVFDAREKATAGAKEDARRMEEEVAKQRAHFEGELRKVRAASGEDREKLRAEAQKLARELTEKARTEAMAAQKQAKDKLEHEAGEVRQRLLREVPALAKQIAGKLLGRSVL
ncbi:MAG TPA: ATP synthase F0 subunit B [Polyangiales bacterium]